MYDFRFAVPTTIYFGKGQIKHRDEYGRNVWLIEGEDDMKVACEAIDRTAEFFFVTMGMPKNLRAVGISEQVNFEKMAQKAAEGYRGSFVPLSREDIEKIFKAAF